MHQSKACQTCKQIKSLDCYNNLKASKDGKDARCRECKSAQFKKWVEKNKKYNSQRNKDWIQNNRDKNRATKNAWNQAHPEKAQQRTKEWIKANPDKKRLANDKWEKENPDKIRLKARNWRKNNPEKARNRYMAYQSLKKRNKTFVVSKKELKKIYSSPCLYCGSKENPTMEHLIPRNLGGDHGIGNLATLCKSCNSSKRDKTWMEFRIWKSRQEESPQSPTHD